MTDGLDVIIMDDDPEVCEVLSEIVKRFYTWGEVIIFTDIQEAISYCRETVAGVAIFILDVFMKEMTGFNFLDHITEKYPMAHEDTIMITGFASDDVVNTCIASDINYLLEKPIRPYALQLAVRAIVNKYIRFAKKLLADPDFAGNVSKF